MQDATDTLRPDLIRLATDIVTAYVSKNSVTRAELPLLIGSIHEALNTLGRPAAEAAPELKPAVPVRKSITPDFLISLEDGRPYKTLKRHLNNHGLTPDEYRRKWSLPAAYPMVAPNYAQRRSELAKGMGLGQKRRKTTAKGTRKKPA